MSRCTSIRGLLLLLAFWLVACHWVAPYTGSTDSSSPGHEAGPPPDRGPVPHDQGPPPVPDTSTPRDTGPQPPCAAVAEPHVEQVSKTGDWRVVLAKGAYYQDVKLNGAAAGEAAAVLDITGQASGFVLTRAGNKATTVEAALRDVLSQLAKWAKPAGVSVTQISGGVKIRTHDQHPALTTVLLQITLPSLSTPPKLRATLLSRLAGGASAIIPSWGYPGDASTKFVLALSLVLRPSGARQLIMGGVAETSRAQDRATRGGRALLDWASASNLGRVSASVSKGCLTKILDGRPPAVDLLFVADVYGSMMDDAQMLIAAAPTVTSTASMLGLDVRYGVTGMATAAANIKAKAGKLCSDPKADPAGGADRFLASTETATLSSCLKDPPYGYFGGQEFGLEVIREAVVTHLPRRPGSAKDLTRVRQEAHLALVMFTDETPNELLSSYTYKGQKGYLSGKDLNPGTCTLDSSKAAQVSQRVAPVRKLLLGQDPTHKAGAVATLHHIGGVCSLAPLCKAATSAQPPWGYQDLVASTGGVMAHICQSSLKHTMQLIVAQAAARASPLKLDQRPVSATLAMRISAVPLPRNTKQGFLYDASANALLLAGFPYLKGQAQVAYMFWK